MKGNPLEAMDGVYNWLKDLEKIDGPTEPKLPVPISVLRLLFLLMDDNTLNSLVRRGALSTGFFLLLRSAEYLRGDGEPFDPQRSLTWADLQCKANGKLCSFEEAAEALRLKREEVEITFTLLSFKNNLETCTRTIKVVYGSPIWRPSVISSYADPRQPKDVKPLDLF